jgi:exonuclease III
MKSMTFNKQNPDTVAFFQEYDNKKPLDGFKHFENGYPIVKIQSKYPISESGIVRTDVNNGICIYADIKISGKLIRFVNVYMEPFFLDKKMVKPTKDMDVNEQKAKKVLHMLIPTFKKHQTQIDQIKDFINTSPYPVIVGGDFNAVPNFMSITKFQKICRMFFSKSEKEAEPVFTISNFLKIDHIFASESIEPISYKVDRSVRISDHFPVIAEFYIQ